MTGSHRDGGALVAFLLLAGAASAEEACEFRAYSSTGSCGDCHAAQPATRANLKAPADLPASIKDNPDYRSGPLRYHSTTKTRWQLQGNQQAQPTVPPVNIFGRDAPQVIATPAPTPVPPVQPEPLVMPANLSNVTPPAQPLYLGSTASGAPPVLLPSATGDTSTLGMSGAGTSGFQPTPTPTPSAQATGDYVWNVRAGEAFRDIVERVLRERLRARGVTWNPTPGEVEQLCRELFVANWGQGPRGPLQVGEPVRFPAALLDRMAAGLRQPTATSPSASPSPTPLAGDGTNAGLQRAAIAELDALGSKVKGLLVPAAVESEGSIPWVDYHVKKDVREQARAAVEGLFQRADAATGKLPIATFGEQSRIREALAELDKPLARDWRINGLQPDLKAAEARVTLKERLAELDEALKALRGRVESWRP